MPTGTFFQRNTFNLQEVLKFSCIVFILIQSIDLCIERITNTTSGQQLLSSIHGHSLWGGPDH